MDRLVGEHSQVRVLSDRPLTKRAVGRTLVPETWPNAADTDGGSGHFNASCSIDVDEADVEDVDNNSDDDFDNGAVQVRRAP